MLNKRLTVIFLASIVSLLPGQGFADKMSEGMAAYKAGRYKEAAKLWQPLADKGDANAQYNIGLLYRNGQGVKQDDRQALVWFSKAAQQGMLDAQYNTGLMYFEGRGVAASKPEAFEWWKLAAAKGHAPSQYNLGVLYAYGIATGKDTAKALELWHKAAKQGHKGARKALFKAYTEGLFGLQADPEKAKQWQD